MSLCLACHLRIFKAFHYITRKLYGIIRDPNANRIMGTLTNWILVSFLTLTAVHSLPFDVEKREVGDTFNIATSRWDITCNVAAITEPRMVYTYEDSGQSFADIYDQIQANPSQRSTQSSTPASGKMIQNTMTMLVGYTLDRYTASDWLAIVTRFLDQVDRGEQPSQDVISCRNPSGQAEFGLTLAWY